LLRRYRGFSREVKLLVTTRSLARLPFGFIRIVQTIYLSLIGFNPFAFGMLLAARSVVGTIAVVPSGTLAYRIGLKKLLAAGILLRSVNWLIYGLTTNYVFLLLGAVLEGLGRALYFSSLHAFTAEKSPDHRRTAVFSLTSFASTGSTFAGSLMSGLPTYLRETVGLGVVEAYRPLFLLTVVLMLAATLALVPVREVKTTAEPINIMETPSKETIGKFGVTNSLLGMGAGFIVPYLSYWFFATFGVDESFIGLMFAATDLTTAMSYLLAPRLAQRLGAVKSIATTEFVATLVLAAIPLSGHVLWAALLFILRGLLMHVSLPVQSSFMMGQVESEERALAASVASPPLGLFWGIPRSASESIGGYLIGLGFLTFPFYLCASFYLASIGAFYALFRHAENEE
jgi:predicted MFS family arabinose efflux permease